MSITWPTENGPVAGVEMRVATVALGALLVVTALFIVLLVALTAGT